MQYFKGVTACTVVNMSGHSYYAIIHFSNLSNILTPHPLYILTTLTMPAVVKNQIKPDLGPNPSILPHYLDPVIVDFISVPRRIMHEVVQIDVWQFTVLPAIAAIFFRCSSVKGPTR